MNKSKWTWLPHPAHLIVSYDCRFVMATELGNGIIVSTVGEYFPSRSVREIHASIYDPEWHSANNGRLGDDYDDAYMRRFGWEDLGSGRTYETMVFKSKPSTPGKCPACPFVIDSGHNYDMDGYTDAGDAHRGHLAMCEKWADKSVADLEAENE